MREIEFRGKRPGNGEWVHGRGYLADNGTIGYPASIYSDRHGEWREICDETLGRYTGLRDKNGKKIFEGDILEWGHYKWICQVSWLEDTARFLYITVDRRLLYPGEASACAVIGNIHDSPELLQASDG